MGNSKYTSGRNKEYQTKQVLEKEGYIVLRSAGSKGVFDIVAIGDTVVRLIQVKSTIKDVKFNDEIERLRSINTPACCTKELWVYYRGKPVQIYTIDNAAHNDETS